MPVTGNWTLHFSWGCTGNYGQTAITFNTDGSFTGPSAGQWRQREGTLLLSFNGGPAKYGGTVNGNVGSGSMSTFAGLDGCWYLVRAGTVGLSSETATATAGRADAAGNPVGAGLGTGGFDVAGNPL